MKNNLTNLLPEERRKALKRFYQLRLFTLGIFMLAFLIIATALMRAPLYLYETQQLKTSQAELDALTSELNQGDGTEISARLKRLDANASYLSRLGTTSQATTIIHHLLQVPRTGIQITAISYTPASKGQDGRLILTGVASTRESLRGYVARVSSQPYIKSADLPISAYAKESDIPFNITLTGDFAL